MADPIQGANVYATDVATLDLLRKGDALKIQQLSNSLGVTATAVRQRLNRLMAQGYIERTLERTSSPSGRGRPSHCYRLTAKGRRKTGANFADLAVALWQEVRSIQDLEVRRGLLQRISRRLVSMYADQIEGETIEQRMQSLKKLLSGRNIPVAVESSGGLPVLTVLACPYPDLAEQDRTICSMERIMFAELLGENLTLNQCRLDEGSCCTFVAN